MSITIFLRKNLPRSCSKTTDRAATFHGILSKQRRAAELCRIPQAGAPLRFDDRRQTRDCQAYTRRISHSKKSAQSSGSNIQCYCVTLKFLQTRRDLIGHFILSPIWKSLTRCNKYNRRSPQRWIRFQFRRKRRRKSENAARASRPPRSRASARSRHWPARQLERSLERRHRQERARSSTQQRISEWISAHGRQEGRDFYKCSIANQLLPFQRSIPR